MANYLLDQTGAEVQAILNAVQAPDTTPVEGSTKLITSGGVQAALAGTAQELNAEVAALGHKVGDLADLDTTDKSSIVAAINEAAQTGGGANLTGYVAVASIGDLPDPGQDTLGYLVGENLYLYVGTGGDTADGKYQNCGPFRGPQGLPGADGATGPEGPEGPEGPAGVDSVAVSVDAQTGVPYAEVSLSGDVLTIVFHNLKGEQGNTGSSVSYPFTIVNNLTTDDATQALSAAQGKFLQDEFNDLFVSELQTEIDLSSYTQINYNLENGSTWASNSSYRCELIPVADLGAGKLKFVADTYKFSYAFLKSNNAANGVAPDLCSGTSIYNLAAGNQEEKDIPADCNYLYVYMSQNNYAVGKIHLYKLEEVADAKVVMKTDIVNALDSDATNKPLSAAQGKVLYQILDNTAGTETIEKDNDNATAADIKQYMGGGGNTRGYILINRDGAEHYGIDLTIAANSPLKFGLGLTANLPGQGATIYDSGWKTSGTYSITEAQGNDNVLYIYMPFTYISGDSGVPTISEVLQYATFRIYATKDIPGGLIQDVADLQSLPRDPFVTLKQSQDWPVFSIGASQVRNLACFTLYDLKTLHNMMDLQSVVVDKANKRLILNRAATTSRVVGFATDEFSWGDLSVGSIGHGNDACMVGSDMWVAGGNALDSSNIKRIFKSNLAGSATYTDIPIPDNAGGGTQRVIGGISRYLDDDTLLLACFDYRGNYNNTGDLLVVYTYKITTATLTEVFSTQWDGWFIQGATFIGGYLYIATNMVPAGGSTYTGIRIWKIDAMAWTLADKMEFAGVFEPEGIDSMYENVTPCLYMGMTSYQSSPNMCAVLKMEAF